MLTRRHQRGGDRWTLSVYGLFICIILLAVPACSPKIVERIVVQHDTTTVHHRDTTYRRDSVSVREVHDTTAVEVKVEKPLSWAQKAKIGAFPWLLLGLIGALVWIFRKWIF